MSLNKQDLWADLRFAKDELESPPLDDTFTLLGNVGNLEEQPEKEFLARLFSTSAPYLAYSRAKARADTRNAHEAIEKGLKAILLDSGLPLKKMSNYSHELPDLLEAVRNYDPNAFRELERCFESTIQYLESVTNIQHNTSLIKYFRQNGTKDTFNAIRYASIEGKDDAGGRVILLIHLEIIRALVLLATGYTPKDIVCRVEDEVRKTILEMSKLDPTWDVEDWLSQGVVLPRLKVVEDVQDNKVIRAAVRRCARKSANREVRDWAISLRYNLTSARKKALSERRSV
ncbi:MAG: hypothetical protein OXF50_06730 [Caldilineaceae bacterium]|nr:hypothetical protein [Caldilineaceae bacterium]